MSKLTFISFIMLLSTGCSYNIEYTRIPLYSGQLRSRSDVSQILGHPRGQGTRYLSGNNGENIFPERKAVLSYIYSIDGVVINDSNSKGRQNTELQAAGHKQNIFEILPGRHVIKLKLLNEGRWLRDGILVGETTGTSYKYYDKPEDFEVSEVVFDTYPGEMYCAVLFDNSSLIDAKHVHLDFYTKVIPCHTKKDTGEPFFPLPVNINFIPNN